MSGQGEENNTITEAHRFRLE